ncbi:hypothetical protein F5Y13DRAFT_182153 [Hypoxylon sp. FL1857]|nr:hypothetical protein F5Y13DRAFT_182153 [Hypoxylon sp. FL1857]
MQQSYSKGLMISLAIAFIIVPSIFVGLRIWSRRLKRKALQLDDYLCLGALVVGIVCSSLQLYAAIDGQLGQHQVVGPDGQPILDDRRFLVYETTKFVVNVLSVVGFGLVKSSILIFYKSIFNTVRAFRWAVYGMLAIVTTWTISYFFANLFTCYPITALVEPFYGNKCINSIPMWLSVVITDVIVDVGILLMPVPMVLRLHLPWKERMGVLGMFMLGACVCAISITRIVTLGQIAAEFIYHYNDETYYTSPVFYWTNIELAMAVVSACLPTLRPIWILALFSFLALTGLTLARSVESSPVAEQLRSELQPHLSRNDLISTETPPRWSSFDAPHPAAVINVETELDVATTVKYCTSRNIPFLAQNGGNGWATTFNLGTNGVLIDLARLNQVSFNVDRTQVTIGGGSNISNTITHAYAAKALVHTGNCNCVGTLGAILGGGYGNLMGLFGFGVDNVLSLRVVTADGQLRNVTSSSDSALFWALRGAGPNLGIVTSAVLKSYPALESDMDMQAWTGSLVFNPDKLEEVVQAIQDLDLQPDMNIFMYFISGGLPTNEPAVIITPFLHKGNATSGRAAFAAFYAIGPESDTTAVISYDQWNSGSGGFCAPGARKPSYGVGFQRMVPATWRQIWNEYIEFQQRPTAQNSVVLLEAYSLIKARSEDPNSAAFPHRGVNFNAVAIPWYDDTSLDDEAQAFGSAARDLWRATDDLAYNSTYVNFAHGDEDLGVVYGSSLTKLLEIKRQFDPNDQFNQWFNLK